MNWVIVVCGADYEVYATKEEAEDIAAALRADGVQYVEVEPDGVC